MAFRASSCCLHSCSSAFASTSRRPFSTAPFPTNHLARPTPTRPPKVTTMTAAAVSAAALAAPKVMFDQPHNITYPQNQVQSTRMSLAHGTGSELRRTSLKGAFSNARFRISVARKEYLPARTNLQEIIFAGRSNVGKSSLVNALVCSDSLVKTSSRPGHTKMLNFFDVPNQMVLVDAPGYGERGRPEWGELFSYYVTQHPPGPPSLLVVLYPLGHKLLPSDQQFLASLPSNLNVLPVFTKCDEVTPREITAKRAALERAVQAARESAWTEEDAQGKGTLLDSVCVSTKRKFPLRDETLELLRKAILDHLDATVTAHREAQRAFGDQAKAECKARLEANAGKGAAERAADAQASGEASGKLARRSSATKRPAAGPQGGLAARTASPARSRGGKPGARR